VVDPTQTFQTMQGFGASITDASASVLYTLPAAQRAQVMASLFSPTTGDGLDYLRQPIGGTDMVATAPYTYDDLPAGQTDYAMKDFSIAHDQAQILPLLREAEKLNPHLQIMASPWSPPAWMKTGSDSLIGGRLIATPQMYQSYALYLLKFIEAYQANGVHVNALTVQNEPQNRTADTYPGTDMPSWQEAAVIEDLGPMLKAAHLHTRYSPTTTTGPRTPTTSPARRRTRPPDVNDYPQQVLSSPAAKWISGIAEHCYYGDPSAMTTLHEQYPNKLIDETECSGSQSADPADTFSDTLKWHARNLEIGSTRNWSSTVVNWDLALNPQRPARRRLRTCTGIVTVGPGDTVTNDAEYYALGQLSRFVQPGAVRIGSTSFGTTGWNGEVMDVAFANPDGSTVLVAHNENDNPQAFAVQEGDQRFTYTLPGTRIATFVWHGNLAGQPPAPAGQPDRLDRHRQPGDHRRGRRGQRRGRRRQHPLLHRRRPGPGPVPPGRLRQEDPARQVVFDTGASTGDYPRGYTAEVSKDGTHWTTVVADGHGTGQFTTSTSTARRSGTSA
jgi:glucosylceramidase